MSLRCMTVTSFGEAGTRFPSRFTMSWKTRLGCFGVEMWESRRPCEVSYLDQIELLAVDHPAETDIFTNEKWKGPPYPEFRLFGVSQRTYPKRASDGEGRNVLQALVARDRNYVDTFRRERNGKAELHALTLDFGNQAAPHNRGVLVLNGWVDWADGSTFLRSEEHTSEL